jgi:hypothetical protein
LREQILSLIRDVLNERNHFFVREEDVQLYLANCFLQSELFENVFIEYHVPSSLINEYPWQDANNIYIDIVLQVDDVFYPIEIKYKSKPQAIMSNIFGGEHEIILRNHGAQNIGCYDFWKDVKRCEIFESNFQNAQRGIVVFVTNDETYLNPPLNNNVGYANFSIHDGRIVEAGSILDWNGDLVIADTRPPISIQYRNELDWSDFGYLEQHKFLII